MAEPSDPASLENLHDLVVPAPVPWWPPAPGWYWLAGVIVLLAVWSVWQAHRRYRANGYRRAALAEFGSLAREAADPAAADMALRALPALLKRTALAAFPRARVAAFSGPPWWAFLDRTSAGSGFVGGGGPVLDKLAYDPSARVEPAERRVLLAAAETWLRCHRRDAGNSPC